MARKSLISTLAICVALAATVTTGCKKEETPKEAAPAAGQQAAAPVTGAAVAEYAFEDGTGGWKPVGKTMKLEQATGQKHGGSLSLKVFGSTGATTWNFAASPQFTLEPGKKYRLSGWIMVDSTSDPKNPPFLKVAVNKDGKWLTNANTKRYNLGKIKEWQELSAEFSTPSEQNLTGFVALEKGTNKSDINATIFVDDVKVESIQ
jgi:hypothetical protein